MSRPLQHEKPTGTRKVKYAAGSEWDFAVETSHQPIDLSLVLPHYRARHQPVNHRMSMFVGSHMAPIRVKVVSPAGFFTRSFSHYVHAYNSVANIPDQIFISKFKVKRQM